MKKNLSVNQNNNIIEINENKTNTINMLYNKVSNLSKNSINIKKCRKLKLSKLNATEIEALKLKETDRVKLYKNKKNLLEIMHQNKLKMQKYNLGNKTNYINTHKVAVINFENIAEQEININYLGEMNMICPHCDAKHFMFERTSDGYFSSCCQKGMVILQDDPVFPVSIKNMSINKKFLNETRMYNNELALASFTTTLVNIKGKGPPIVKICGQVYHNVTSLHPYDENCNRQYGQVYILDNETATQCRLNNIKNTIDPTMEKNFIILDKILRKNTP